MSALSGSRALRVDRRLPMAAWAAALVALDGMTVPRLRALLDDHDPQEAWSLLAAGRLPGAFAALAAPDGSARWRSATAACDPAEVWRRCREGDMTVHVRRWDASFPAALGDDRGGPAVLFARGDLGALDRPLVSIVGTRNATVVGRDIAFELGAGLAAAGLGVVSGLAAGIDAASHRGALSVDDGAPPIGVVGSGLDICYPVTNRQLWQSVAERGLLLSEYPPGTRPLPTHFPLRNRIIAALGDPLVVVESHERGGSLITVAQAERRGRTIMAVPGSVRSPASVGTNKLLRDGCLVALDTLDVLVAAGLATAGRGGRVGVGAAQDEQLCLDLSGHDPSGDDLSGDAWVLDALAGGPATADDLVARTGRDLDAVIAAVARLDDGGAIDQRGPWIGPTASSTSSASRRTGARRDRGAR